MITKLHLKRFQIHNDSTFIFDKGLNVINGESDQGKSSIIRAFRFVIENKNPASGAVQFGCEANAVVELQIDDKEITRVRGKKDNYYLFNGEKYKALRTDVPSEISSVINFGEPNLKPQYPEHYLITDSPGEVARKLNSFIGLDDIDKSQKIVNSIISSTKNEISKYESIIDKTKEDLKEYKNIDQYDEILTKCENEWNNIVGIKAKIENLGEIISLLLDYTEKLPKYTRVCDLKNKVDSFIEESTNLENSKQSIKNLKIIIEDLESKKQSLKESSINIDINHINMLIKEYNDIEEKKKGINILNSLIKVINLDKKKHRIAKNNVEKLTKKYADTMKDIGICPLCNTRI